MFAGNWPGVLEHFGSAAAERYAVLVRQALRDLSAGPTRPGAKPRPELAPNAYVYHLSFSRDHVPGDHVPGERLKSPRHFILYRFSGQRLELSRLLRDRCDLERHLPSGFQLR